MTLLRYTTTQRGPKGRPVVSYGYQFIYKGQRFRAMVGPTEEMAREAERRERIRVAEQRFSATWGPLKPQVTTFEDAVARFLEAKSHKASLDHDHSRLTWWQQFLSARGVRYLQELDPDAVMAGRRALEREQKAAPATVYQYFAVLRSLCQLAVRRWKIIKDNPLFAVDWPRPKPQDVRMPTPAQFRALLKSADSIIRPVILTAAYTGLREGAVIKLTAEDRRYRKGWIRGSEEKGDKTVWIFETPALKKVLDGQRVKTGPLFRWEDGRPLLRFPRKRWVAAREAAGIPWFRFHFLRHMSGQLLAEEGVPVRTIQKYLGHSSVGVTERYTQQLTQPLREASEKLSRRIGGYRQKDRANRGKGSSTRKPSSR